MGHSFPRVAARGSGFQRQAYGIACCHQYFSFEQQVGQKVVTIFLQFAVSKHDY
jgi:hypothetical protein